MRRLLTTAAIAVMAIAAGAMPAAATEDTDHPPKAVEAAKRACEAQAKAHPRAFLLRYGPREGAMRRCVRAKLRSAARATRAAVRHCRIERRLHPVAFQRRFADEQGELAMRRCVAWHLRLGGGSAS